MDYLLRSISVEQVISALFAFLKTKRHPTGKKGTFNKRAYNKVLRLYQMHGPYHQVVKSTL